MKLEMLIARAKYFERTQKDMAKKLGTSPSRFADWKNGKTKPSPYEIFKIAEMARLEPESTFYDVMTEIDEDNADYWCARRESNPRPSASETVSKQYSVTEVYNLVSKDINGIASNHSQKLSISTCSQALLITVCYIVEFTKSFLLLPRIANNQGVHSASY